MSNEGSSMRSGEEFSVGRWVRSRTGLALLGFLAISLFFLVTEHTAHFFGVLPYVLLLLCPLLHFFMHGKHGEHSQLGSQNKETNHEH